MKFRKHLSSRPTGSPESTGVEVRRHVSSIPHRSSKSTGVEVRRHVSSIPHRSSESTGVEVRRHVSSIPHRSSESTGVEVRKLISRNTTRSPKPRRTKYRATHTPETGKPRTLEPIPEAIAALHDDCLTAWQSIPSNREITPKLFLTTLRRTDLEIIQPTIDHKGSTLDTFFCKRDGYFLIGETNGYYYVVIPRRTSNMLASQIADTNGAVVDEGLYSLNDSADKSDVLRLGILRACSTTLLIPDKETMNRTSFIRVTSGVFANRESNATPETAPETKDELESAQKEVQTRVAKLDGTCLLDGSSVLGTNPSI